MPQKCGKSGKLGMVISLDREIIDRTGGQTILCFSCSMMPSVELTRYGVSRAKDFGIQLFTLGKC